MKTSAFAVAVLFLCTMACAADNDTGLVLHYSFDRMNRQVVSDLSGNGNDGNIVGGARQTRGAYGTALELNGVDGYVDSGAADSLNIGEAGTVMFWFKAKDVCQGGLVGWFADAPRVTVDESSAAPATSEPFNRPGHSASAPAATVKENQRVVVSLNSFMEDRVDGNHERQELGIYISDGEHFDSPHRSNQHKPYYPTSDQWFCYAVKFDGRSIDVYRDGEHVITRFQALIPDTANVPLLIGRCFGMGGASDFFKGWIDEVRVYSRALSSQEIYERYMRDAAGRGKPTEHFGGIAIEAAAYPRPGIVFADLDYRSLLQDAESADIHAVLCDRTGAEIAQADIHMLPAWGRAEARVDVADLPAGRYTLRVTADDATAQSAEVDWPGRAPGWENIKVLNNLCWELLNESPGAAVQTQYTFNNPRRGWVYFIIDADDDVTMTVSDATPAMVHGSGDSARPEVMRWLEAGEHHIDVAGQGTLRQLVVRSVPILAYHHYPHVGPGTGNDHDFLVDHVLSPYNTILTHNYGEEYNPGQFRQKWASELGRHVFDHIYPAAVFDWYRKLKDDTARQQIWDHVTSSAGMNLDEPEYQGVIMDEFTAGEDRIMWTKSYLDEWREVCAEIMADPKHAGRFIMPTYGYNMYDFKKSSDYLRMFVEHGCPLFEQVYFNERDTEEQAWLYVNESSAAVEHRWKEELPGYTEVCVKWISYLQREIFNPGVDFKVHLELQFEHYATRPEFFGVGGLAAYSSYNCNNEEYVRWVAQLCRHYGLEGNTERLSSAPYEVDHIRDPDFADGTENWTLHPAESGSMAVKHFPGYGALQERQPYRAFTDTTFLWTKRSSQKPNTVSQEIRNLEPGKLYMVRLWIGDFDELVSGTSKDEPRAINLQVDGGEIWNDWYRSKAYDNDPNNNVFSFASYLLPPFGGGNRYYFKIQQVIFRATGATAQLTIGDWQSETDPGGPVGQELMLNFIDVHPYLEPQAAQHDWEP